MSGAKLYLGKKASVSPNGDVDFSTAVLLSNGSALSTHAQVATAKADADTAITAAKVDADNAMAAAIAAAAGVVSADFTEADAAMAADFTEADNALRDEISTGDGNVRTEFAAADTLLRGEFAVADNVVRAEFAVADTLVRAEFALAVGAIDAKLDDKINSLLSNTHLDALDSFAEVVVQARGMTGISRRGLTKLGVNSCTVPDEQNPIPQEFAGFPRKDPRLGYDGWYFKNTGVQDKNKINWVAPPGFGMKNRDISALVIDNWVISTDSPVFLTVYTKRIEGKTYTNDELPLSGSSWYKCRTTYIVDRTKLLVAGPSSFTVKLDPTAPELDASYAHKKVDMVMEEFSSRRKNAAGVLVDLAEDEILDIRISSDSAAAAGNVETIVKALKIQQSSGVNSFVFENADVLGDFMNIRTIALYKAFFGKDIMGPDRSFIPDASPAPATADGGNGGL